MHSLFRCRVSFPVGVGFLACVFVFTAVADDKSTGESTDKSSSSEQATAQPSSDSVALARTKAKLMHDMAASTLEVMHQYYFHEERAVVPARALEDVFRELGQQSKMNARWISVNTKPMSLNHEPRDAFEKKAAAEISKGKEEYEEVEGTVYRRAAAIPLSNGCVGCHTNFFSSPPKTPRFAGLVISVPLADAK